MDVEVKFDLTGVDWDLVSGTLRDVEMSYYEPGEHRRAFENSYVTVFAYHNNQLIGFGRALSDGTYQAAIYDLAVNPDFQEKGVGKIILKNIAARLPQCNIILYASPGKEGFYEKNKFRKMKTGMALFSNAEKMAANGFTE